MFSFPFGKYPEVELLDLWQFYFSFFKEPPYCFPSGCTNLHSYQLCICMLSCFSHIFVTLWTVALQAPLSMWFSRQAYWSGLPYPLLGALPHFGIEFTSLMSPALAGRIFTISTTWKAHQQYSSVTFFLHILINIFYFNLLIAAIVTGVDNDVSLWFQCAFLGWLVMLIIFSCTCGHLHVFYGKLYIQIFCPFC